MIYFHLAHGLESSGYLLVSSMTKLIDCPVCKKKDQPVRGDAKVCSPYCRLKQWREDNKKKETKVNE